MAVTYIQFGLLGLQLLLTAAGPASRRWRHGRRITVMATAFLFLWSWPPTACVFAGSLEWWYSPSLYPRGEAAAIVVLSAGVVPHDVSQAEDLPDRNTYLRCRHAAWLYRHWRPLPIVVSGGMAGNSQPPIMVAAVMRDMLEREGIPAADIWLEGRSQSTYENAVYSAALLRARGIREITLVTEGYHMLRAEGCFRRQGMTVVPAPCSYRSIQLDARWPQFLPHSKSIAINEDMLHEWAGLAWYRLTGRL